MKSRMKVGYRPKIGRSNSAGMRSSRKNNNWTLAPTLRPAARFSGRTASADLPRLGDVRKPRICGASGLVPEAAADRAVERELDQRHELVERLLFRRGAGEAVRQVERTVFDREAPVKRVSDVGRSPAKPASRRVDVHCLRSCACRKRAVSAPAIPKGRNHATSSGRSPNPLPKKMPGWKVLGPPAPTD
jgi:hypothetical protein